MYPFDRFTEGAKRVLTWSQEEAERPPAMIPVPLRRRRGMRYLLVICDDETDKLSPEEIRAWPAMAGWISEMDARGVRRGGTRLRPSADATTVRVRDGELLLTDGPYAETKEQMGGFDLVECENLDEAIEIAARHPTAANGSIEVRPVWDEM